MSVSGSKPVILGTRESKVVGDYELKNYRSAMATGPSGCPDAFVADTTVLVARTSLLSEQPPKDAGPDDDGGATDFQTIGCYPANELLTEDDRCAKSPDGQIFGGISGTLVARLIAESGYSNCSDREEQAWSDAAVCAQP
jgi:hypothetical protein